MSGKAGAMREITVVGGGIVGWSAAVALKRRLPALEITLVPVEPPPDALADRMVPTLPSIVEFHRDVGLTEADTVVRAASGFRLGTRFEGWAPEPDSYVHAYGEYGLALGPVPFHQHWLRAAQSGSMPGFDRYSAAAALASSGRFIHPQDGADPLASSYGYGLHIDPPSYREMMRAFALHLGVRERPGQVSKVRLRSDDGFVEALVMEGGEELGGDLFVDASGPSAIIRSAIDSRREDWSAWLPADRILIADQPGRGELRPLDRCVAAQAGWWWEVKAPSRISHGLVYSSRHLSEDESARLFRQAAGADPEQAAIAIAPGRFSEQWLRNCVAIGDSAIAIEPLEWTNLHLAHSAIDRMVAMMPDRDCNPVELWDFNRQCSAEADRARDFAILHYAVAQRDGEEFWSEAAQNPPASLAHTLAQFRERGRLPFYEEETFARDSWVAVLLGQGVIPRRIDPLIDSVSEQESEIAMNRMIAAIERLADTAPPAEDYLQQMIMQAG